MSTKSKSAVRIEDKDAAEWWEKCFGASGETRVAFSEFANKLSPLFESVPHLMVLTMTEHIIDSNQDEVVTADELNEFVQRFGPFSVCVERCAVNLFMSNQQLVPWFHPNVSREQAKAKLTNAGRFLIRFSGNNVGRFALHYARVKESKLVIRDLHILISSDGFTCPALDKTTFDTLGELVNALRERLVITLKSDLYQELYERNGKGVSENPREYKYFEPLSVDEQKTYNQLSYKASTEEDTAAADESFDPYAALPEDNDDDPYRPLPADWE
eukprot:TRINITY_DN57930_c0_g1_i1.p1 TRINITY_DN57930_c0_g1~~TRINITY_DN57930_c0_g1_i1.p1  ORF type:complete len:286 (-),score=115.23 TRINITY_DN57930_c0_g1_i1:54-869(-)